MRAWLAHEQSPSMSFPSICNTTGTRQTASRAINDCFASYYAELYSTKVSYSMEDLYVYLSDVDFPVLTSTYRDQLDSPITLMEVKQVMSSLQGSKTPGPDGFPTEFYEHYMEDLAARIHAILLSSLRTGSLLASMAEAVMVVVPKLGKNPEHCKSYRLISLINVDAKILAKILANRLNKVITALIHPDQSG